MHESRRRPINGEGDAHTCTLLTRMTRKSGIVLILFTLSILIVTRSSHAGSCHGSSLLQLNHAIVGNMFSDMNNVPSASRDDNDPLSIYATPRLSTGTTICGLQCVDGVVLGADSRSTSGQLIADQNKQKIRQLAPSVVIAGAGTSADCERIARHVAHLLALARIDGEMIETNELSSEDSSVVCIDSIAYALKLIGGHLRGEGGLKGREKPEAVFILGGVECIRGEFKSGLFRIERDGSSQQVEFAALGSGGPNAISVLESELYARKKKIESEHSDNIAGFGSIQVEDAVDIIRKAVNSGIMNDLGSGNCLDICIIKEDGVKRWREKIDGRDEEAVIDDTLHAEDEGRQNDDVDSFDASELGTCVYRRNKEQEGKVKEIFGVKTGISVSSLVE